MYCMHQIFRYTHYSSAIYHSFLHHLSHCLLYDIHSPPNITNAISDHTLYLCIVIFLKPKVYLHKQYYTLCLLSFLNGGQKNKCYHQMNVIQFDILLRHFLRFLL
jgi:hypothetical protein